MIALLTHLSPVGMAACILALVTSYIVIGSIVNYRKLSKFNGPPLAGYSRAYMFWQIINKRFTSALCDITLTYGPVCRLGPNILVTNDPELLRHISAPRSKWTRGPWYDSVRFDPRQDSVFSTRDEKLHAELKSKMIAAYNNREIDTYETDIDERIIELMDVIRTKYNNKPMDFARIAQFFTLDVLSSIAFGRKFGYMEANRDLWDYNKTSAQFLPVLELVINHRFFYRLLNNPVMQRLAAPSNTDEVGIGPVLGFAYAAAAERFDGGSKVAKCDMLNHLINKGLSKTQVEVEAALQIIAGSDSTSSVLRMTMFYLISSTVAFNKLRAEIDAAVAAGELSFPVVSHAQAQSLPYLQACLLEGLRIKPPLTGSQAKLAPKGGDTFGGMFFPEGTEVGFSPMAVCRNKEVFGTDNVGMYDPDRWLRASTEERHQMERTVDLIFGSGRYGCLGKNIAFMELGKVFVELVRNYDWIIVDPIKGVDTVEAGLYLQSNMWLLARPRN